MRCNPWRWLWGLIPIVMLTWVAFHLQRPVIEADLTNRAQQTLDEAGFDWAEVQFSGRDAIVSGRAPDEGTPRKAIQAVRSIWGVRVVRAKTDLIRRVSTYSWTAAVRENRITVSGHVPNTDTRQSVLRIIKTNFPKFEIEDDMNLARGGPEADLWLARISFAMKQLRYLTRGRVQLTNDELRISGEALDFTSYKTLGSQLSGVIPHGISRTMNEVTRPTVDPFEWQVKLEGQQLVLNGHVPNERLREDLFARAKAGFSKLAIVDRMETARGAPRGWDRVAKLALSQLARMTSGEAELIGRDLSVVGKTTTEARADEIVTTLRRELPETYKLVENITFPKPVYPVSSPYVTTVEWQNQAVLVTGSVPGPLDQSWLLEFIKQQFPDAEVNSKVGFASGQINGWKSCLTAGLESLKKFSAGRIQIVGRRLELRTKTPDESLYNTVPGELRAAANRACDTEALIELQLPEEPDLTWRAVRSESEIVLEGEVPGAQEEVQLVDTATKLYPDGRVINRMDVVESQPGNWLQVAQLGLRMLVNLRTGEAVLHDQNLLVRGEAADTATATSIKTQLERDIAKGYQGRDRIEVRSSAMIWAEQEAARRRLEARALAADEAKRLATAEEERRLAEAEARRQKAAAEEAERRRREAEQALQRRKEAKVEAKQCETELTSAATEGVILFDVSRASLKSQSYSTLDRLAELVRNCKTGIVEISGHTDSDGSDDFNLELSQKRAESVMRYLAKSGVKTSRMRAIGYGETKPVVPNTNERNKAENRRIEFKVMLN